MTIQNLHTHTVFGDGKNTAEEMVLGAIAAGCQSLGFSEHSPLPDGLDPEGWSMEAADIPAYRAEVLRLREQYAGRLEIFLGLEQDMDSPAPAFPTDYLIGSVHSVWAEGEYLSVDNSNEKTERAICEFFGGDPYAYAAAYYRRVAEVAEKTCCQIVGHFDLVTKFNEGGRLFDEADPRYLSAAREALDALTGRDVIFEINTGAMSRGYRSAPYPSPALLDFLRDRGGRICVTSDSHSASTILHAFPQARELAKSRGFREVWVLTKSGFCPEAL